MESEPSPHARSGCALRSIEDGCVNPARYCWGQARRSAPTHARSVPAAIGALAPGVGNPVNGMVVPAFDKSVPPGLHNSPSIATAPRFGFAYDPEHLIRHRSDAVGNACEPVTGHPASQALGCIRVRPVCELSQTRTHSAHKRTKATRTWVAISL